jgi:hypothetical protein
MTDYSGRYDRLILDVIRKRFEANAGTWGAAREVTVFNCAIAMFNAAQIVRRPRLGGKPDVLIPSSARAAPWVKLRRTQGAQFESALSQ